MTIKQLIMIMAIFNKTQDTALYKLSLVVILLILLPFAASQAYIIWHQGQWQSVADASIDNPIHSQPS